MPKKYNYDPVPGAPVEPRELPEIPYATFIALKGKELRGLAGFNRYVKSSRLDRAYKTVPQWDELYRAFMARPTR